MGINANHVTQLLIFLRFLPNHELPIIIKCVFMMIQIYLKNMLNTVNHFRSTLLSFIQSMYVFQDKTDDIGSYYEENNLENDMNYRLQIFF